jgi:hypothetical protein
MQLETNALKSCLARPMALLRAFWVFQVLFFQRGVPL